MGGENWKNRWGLLWKKLGKRQGVVGVFCIVIGLIAFAEVVSSSDGKRINSLERPVISAGSITDEVIVVRENGEQISVKIDLDTRLLREEEAEEVFRQVLEQLPDLIIGDNVSLQLVRTDLELPEIIRELGVRLQWESDSPEELDSLGRVVKGRIQTEPKQVCLKVTMSIQQYQYSEEIFVTVLPEAAADWETRLEQELIRLEASSREEGKLTLPTVFEGEQLTFVQREDVSRTAGLALMPAAVGLILLVQKGQTEDKQKKKRQEAIEADYPELIVKMTVLYQAGLSMRSVWERIGADEKKKKGKMRPIYEEVCFACNSMADGLSEVEAYRLFGQKCCTSGCLKLGNLLAGNVRRGTKQLSELMSQESARAWEQRKHRARRSGEKAGTKMLLPMFMMFGVVLVIVVIPAFYSFMI